ncbi:MAG: hypothetical protein CM1200mP34_4030 [Verrucomicrobiales bacterium]|nr:MAG: hypothetical protein CM1200mP34_4030 [Verrucomicrobiales bacterium]
MRPSPRPNSERHLLNQSIEANRRELREYQNKASTEYNAAFRSHQLKIAGLKLAVVVPLLFFFGMARAPESR